MYLTELLQKSPFFFRYHIKSETEIVAIEIDDNL